MTPENRTTRDDVRSARGGLAAALEHLESARTAVEVLAALTPDEVPEGFHEALVQLVGYLHCSRLDVASAQRTLDARLAADDAPDEQGSEVLQ